MTGFVVNLQFVESHCPSITSYILLCVWSLQTSESLLELYCEDMLLWHGSIKKLSEERFHCYCKESSGSLINMRYNFHERRSKLPLVNRFWNTTVPFVNTEMRLVEFKLRQSSAWIGLASLFSTSLGFFSPTVHQRQRWYWSLWRFMKHSQVRW